MGSAAINHAPWQRFYFKQNGNAFETEIDIPKYEQTGIGSLTDMEAS